MTWKEKHDAYLQSEHWSNLRTSALNKANRRCEACSSGKILQGHHLCYREPLESGTIDDIMALCERCHEVWHEHLRANGWTLSQFDRRSTQRDIRALLCKLPKAKKRRNKRKAPKPAKKYNCREVPITEGAPSKYKIPPQYNDKFAVLERVVFAQADEILTLRLRIEALEAKATKPAKARKTAPKATVEIVRSPDCPF